MKYIVSVTVFFSFFLMKIQRAVAAKPFVDIKENMDTVKILFEYIL